MGHQPTTHATVGTRSLETHTGGVKKVDGTEMTQSVTVSQIDQF